MLTKWHFLFILLYFFAPHSTPLQPISPGCHQATPWFVYMYVCVGECIYEYIPDCPSVCLCLSPVLRYMNTYCVMQMRQGKVCCGVEKNFVYISRRRPAKHPAHNPQHRATHCSRWVAGRCRQQDQGSREVQAHPARVGAACLLWAPRARPCDGGRHLAKGWQAWVSMRSTFAIGQEGEPLRTAGGGEWQPKLQIF